MTKPLLDIIYDGECPFCAGYIRLVRLKEGFDVRLIDARTFPELVSAYRAMGYDLSEGMVARVGDDIHYGAEAITFLSAASSEADIWNRLMAAIFRKPRVAQAIYPAVKAGRAMALRLLGRSPVL